MSYCSSKVVHFFNRHQHCQQVQSLTDVMHIDVIVTSANLHHTVHNNLDIAKY